MATLDNVVNSFKPLALGESPTKKITLTTPLRRKDAKDDVENKKEDKKNPDKRNTINEEKKPEERRDKDDARVG